MAEIKPEQVPPEVWSAFHEAVLRYGYKPQAIAAALNAWPGMHQFAFSDNRGMFPAIILPLPTEASDGKHNPVNGQEIAMSDIVERMRTAARIAQLEAEAYEYAMTCRAIPDEFALVPPDGGDVKPWEAVSEMANTITRYREALSILSDHWKHGYGGPTRADVIRAVQDIARAALEDRT